MAHQFLGPAPSPDEPNAAVTQERLDAAISEVASGSGLQEGDLVALVEDTESELRGTLNSLYAVSGELADLDTDVTGTQLDDLYTTAVRLTQDFFVTGDGQLQAARLVAKPGEGEANVVLDANDQVWKLFNNANFGIYNDTTAKGYFLIDRDAPDQALNIGSGLTSMSQDLTVDGDISADNLSGTNTGDEDLSGYLNKSTDDLDDITAGATNKHFTGTEKTKLAGVEAAADVTDAAGVSAAGAVMDGDFTANGLMERTASGTYSTKAVVTESAGIDSSDNDTSLPTSAAVKDYVDAAIGGIESGGVADGNKGDITVASSGAAWSINAGTVGNTEVASGISADKLVDGTTNHVFTAADDTKLAGVETAADVTDFSNVTAAGAFMKSADDLDDITEGTTNKHLTAVLKTKLDGIEAAADVTANATVDGGTYT